MASPSPPNANVITPATASTPLKAPKRKVHCSKCHQDGHNVRTCPQNPTDEGISRSQLTTSATVQGTRQPEKVTEPVMGNEDNGSDEDTEDDDEDSDEDEESDEIPAIAVSEGEEVGVQEEGQVVDVASSVQWTDFEPTETIPVGDIVLKGNPRRGGGVAESVKKLVNEKNRCNLANF